MEYQFIVNPVTNRKCRIDTPLGRKIIKGYAQTGGSLGMGCLTQKCKKKCDDKISEVVEEYGNKYERIDLEDPKLFSNDCNKYCQKEYKNTCVQKVRSGINSHCANKIKNEINKDDYKEVHRAKLAGLEDPKCNEWCMSGSQRWAGTVQGPCNWLIEEEILKNRREKEERERAWRR